MINLNMNFCFWVAVNRIQMTFCLLPLEVQKQSKVDENSFYVNQKPCSVLSGEVFVILLELCPHSFISRSHILDMTFQTLDSEYKVAVSVIETIVQLNLITLTIAHDHLIEFAEDLVIFLLLTNINLLRICKCIRDVLLLIAALKAPEHIHLHLLERFRDRVREFNDCTFVLVGEGRFLHAWDFIRIHFFIFFIYLLNKFIIFLL